MLFLLNLLNQLNFFTLTEGLKNLNPIVHIYAGIGVILLLRLAALRIFKNKKKVHFYSNFLLLATPVIVLGACLYKYTKTPISPFVLQADWQSTILLGHLDSVSAPLAIAMFFVSLIAMLTSQGAPFVFCIRIVLQIGAAIGCIFSQNVMARLFWCEVLSFISISIVLSNRRLGLKMQKTYAMLHMLASTFLLASCVGIISSSFSANPSRLDMLANIIPSISVIIFLVIALGLPPFSFSIVNVYGSMGAKNISGNISGLAALFSKLLPFSVLPIILHFCGGPVGSAIKYFGLGALAFSFIGILKEKSLLKTLLFVTISHSGLFVFALNPNGTLLTNYLTAYIAVNLLATFYIFSIIYIILKVLPNNVNYDEEPMIDNIAKLCYLRSEKIQLKLLFFIIIILVAEIPMSLPGIGGEFLEVFYISSTQSKHGWMVFLFANSIGILAAIKLLASYFSLWDNKSSNITDVANNYSTSQSSRTKFNNYLLFALTIIGFAFVLFGVIIMIILANNHSHSSIDYLFQQLTHYLGNAIVVAGLYFMLAKSLLKPNINVYSYIVGAIDKIKITYNIHTRLIKQVLRFKRYINVLGIIIIRRLVRSEKYYVSRNSESVFYARYKLSTTIILSIILTALLFVVI